MQHFEALHHIAIAGIALWFLVGYIIIKVSTNP